MGVQTVPLPELLTSLRERELLLSIPLSMKPTLLFAFCALITLVSSAPAQAPQHNPAQAEVAALITEVRAQQAAIAANQVKINEKLATLAESIRVANLLKSRRPMMQTLRIFIISLAMLACAVLGVAQTIQPTPVPLHAAAPAPAEDAKQQAETAENIKQLQELKAQNDEILKQQQAALEALDEMQKEAEQLRIYSKRG